MLDLMLLGSPIFCAWWLNYAVLEPRNDVDTDVRWNHPLFLGTRLGAFTEKQAKPITWADIPGIEAPEAAEFALWQEIKAEAMECNLARARIVLDAIPDASCDTIAEGLGLPSHKVRLASYKGRRKGKAVTDYSRAEVLEAANLVNVNDCPF